MAINWTTDKIEALSPDAASLSAGKKLANSRNWKTLGFDGSFAWGQCQGSGKDPYKTEIDLSEPAFKCNCPSRKFPCKHSLGLFLLLATQENSFTQKEQPVWVQEWVESRAKRSEQKSKREATKVANEGKPIDAEKQAKRLAEREAKVDAGVQELELWLKDLIRQGLSTVANQNYSFWDKIAARMVDAQAPGLSRMLKEMASISTSGEGWQERILERLTKIHLLLEGYKRLESLPIEVQQDIKSFIGWTQKQEELLTQSGEQDDWLVLGQKIEQDPLNYSLTIQRVWLLGQTSKKFALILNFSFGGNQGLDKTFINGDIIPAELVFFPSAYPLRAAIKNRQPTISSDAIDFGTSISDFFVTYGQAIAKTPWLERLPIALENVTVSFSQKNWRLIDKNGHQISLAQPHSANYWPLLALSGGHPIKVFGEWYLDKIWPLNIFVNNKFYSI